MAVLQTQVLTLYKKKICKTKMTKKVKLDNFDQCLHQAENITENASCTLIKNTQLMMF